MIRLLLGCLMAVFALGACAQAPHHPAGGAIVITPQSPADAERERRAAERERGEWRGERHDNRYPRWCRGYDRHDYYRELRACGDDYRCRRDVRRKGDRCGF